jgi:hypothetical protein
MHNIVIKWANGLWNAPIFKFREATTRKELCKLSARV